MPWKVIALVLASLAFTAGTLEVAFRSLPESTLGYHYDNGVFKRPREFEVDFTANRLGSHDVEYGPKQPGVRRVLLLGDSFVQGLSVSIPETLARRLQHHLEAKSPGNYDVVSLAGPGFGPREEMKLLKQYGRELEPDLVVSLFLPENDVMDASRVLVAERRRQLSALGMRQGPGMFRITADDARFLLLRDSEFNRWLSHRLTLASLRRDRVEIPIDYYA